MNPHYSTPVIQYHSHLILVDSYIRVRLYDGSRDTPRDVTQLTATLACNARYSHKTLPSWLRRAPAVPAPPAIPKLTDRELGTVHDWGAGGTRGGYGKLAFTHVELSPRPG